MTDDSKTIKMEDVEAIAVFMIISPLWCCNAAFCLGEKKSEVEHENEDA